MVTALDTELRLAAYDIIAEYGKEISFTVPASTTYDPATGGVTLGTETVHLVKTSPPERFDEKYIDGDLIRARDLFVLLPTLNTTFTPTLAMRVEIDSIAYDIVTVTPIYSGEQIAVYELQLRQ